MPKNKVRLDDSSTAMQIEIDQQGIVKKVMPATLNF